MSARSRLAATLAAGLLTGCGVGAGDPPQDGVGLSVTRDYGARQIHASDRADVAGEETIMRMLQRNVEVGTRFGGDFVQSIEGLAGGRAQGRPHDWFLFVNGLLTNEGAAAIEVRSGDRIWWDHHDWGLTPDVPAVVGSFPAPFEHGPEGRPLPVRVECAAARAAPCDAVAGGLAELGVDVRRSALRRSAPGSVLRVLVGPWGRLRGGGREAELIDAGPRSSGVFARFGDDGAALAVLDVRGRVARTLRAGAGLVAATRELERPPVWFVTGTDEAGVARAARALDADDLRDRFALALAGDAKVRVPLPARDGA